MNRESRKFKNESAIQKKWPILAIANLERRSKKRACHKSLCISVSYLAVNRIQHKKKKWDEGWKEVRGRERGEERKRIQCMAHKHTSTHQWIDYKWICKAKEQYNDNGTLSMLNELKSKQIYLCHAQYSTVQFGLVYFDSMLCFMMILTAKFFIFFHSSSHARSYLFLLAGKASTLCENTKKKTTKTKMTRILC